MKNTFKFFVLVIAVMATLAGCSKKEISNEPSRDGKIIEVIAKHGDTKTSLEDGRFVRWKSTDAVMAYGCLDNYVSTETVVEDGGATAKFTFNTSDDEIVYMIYPAAAAGELGSNDWIDVTIPTEQTAVANGFSDGANVAIGEYVEGAADFYSIGALVSFDIKNDNITSIKLECPDAEYAVTGKGTAKIDAENYYGIGDEITEAGTSKYVILKAAAGQTLAKGAKYFAVVYADDYTGMTLTFTRNDGKTATYSNPNKLELDINSNYTIFNIEIPESKWQGGSGSDSETYEFGSFTSAQDVTFEATDFTVEFHKNTGTTNPQWNGTAKEARVYAKGSVVVSSDKLIKKVEYVYTINANNKGKAPNIDSVKGKTDNGTWNAESKTWTGSDSKVTLSTSGDAGNIGFTSITVYFGDSPVVTKYDVNCATVTGGTVSADPVKAEAGTIITLTATPDSGYEFDSWNVTGATVADATSATTTFTMPAANVNVSATFKAAVIPDKTIAEFIAAEGGKCYLTGVVSDITNITYGNYTLTDASGSIVVYGTLNQDGESRKFEELGVVAGDRIKVLASEYELYQEKTDEAKNVTFVEIVTPAPRYAVTVASGIANGTVSVDLSQAVAGQTVTITATPSTGYKVKSVSAKKTASGTAITVTDNKFTMPAEAVTVSAEFEADQSGETTVSLNISTWLSNNPSVVVSAGSNVGSKIASIALDSNISVSVVGTGNTGTFWGTSPNNDWRLYSKSGDEATVSISASNSKKIKSVKFTFSTSNGGGLKYNTTLLTTNKAQAISPSAASVTLTVPYSSNKTGQARITSIEVIYE